MTVTDPSSSEDTAWMLTVTPIYETGGPWSIYERRDGNYELYERVFDSLRGEPAPTGTSLGLGPWDDVWSQLLDCCLQNSADGSYYLETRTVAAALRTSIFPGGGSQDHQASGRHGLLLVFPHPRTGQPVPVPGFADENTYGDVEPVGSALIDYFWADDAGLGWQAGHLLIDIGDGLAMDWLTHEVEGYFHSPELLELGEPGEARARVIAGWAAKHELGELAVAIEPFDPDGRLTPKEAEEWAGLLEDSRWRANIEVDPTTLKALRENLVPPLIRRAFKDPASAAGRRFMKMLVDSSVHDLSVEGSLSRTDIEWVGE